MCSGNHKELCMTGIKGYVSGNWEGRLEREGMKGLTWHGFYPEGNWKLLKENNKGIGLFANVLISPRLLFVFSSHLCLVFLRGEVEVLFSLVSL